MVARSYSMTRGVNTTMRGERREGQDVVCSGICATQKEP